MRADEGADTDPAARPDLPGSGPEDRPDRWQWRRRIRAHPHKHLAYRVVIGVLGTLCIIAGAITGPLPGPGGIPLVLLGLAIWASEFAWARRLLEWFKRKVHQVRGLSRGGKATFWLCFLAACGALGYLSLLFAGVPSWLPGGAEHLLARLPGVRLQH